jgi:hypothetical protein
MDPHLGELTRLSAMLCDAKVRGQLYFQFCSLILNVQTFFCSYKNVVK